MDRQAVKYGLIGIGAFVVLVVLIGSAVMLTGSYNIAATQPHMDITERAIAAMVDASVRNHAGGIEVPELTRADTLAGAAPFDAMCVDCHTAPGVGRAEFAQGLYPLPPKLFGVDTVWTPNELFWIIKNGIKMTGMPAFGPTHNDEEIWSIVAFTSYVRELSYYDYLELQDSVSSSPGEAHEH